MSHKCSNLKRLMFIAMFKGTYAEGHNNVFLVLRTEYEAQTITM